MRGDRPEEKDHWDPGQGPGGTPAPYWRCAHNDWRFLAVVILMLAAMGTYVMTLDLAFRPSDRGLPLVETIGN